MKKWILVVALYGLGGLFVYDVLNRFEWLGLLFDKINEWNHSYSRYFFILMLMMLVLLVLLNYFILRIRAKNPIFTFVNAMFVTVLVFSFMISAIAYPKHGVEDLYNGIFDFEKWKILWSLFPAIFVLCGLNFIAGIVISEAKSKGTYLTAEFIFLLTGLFLALFSNFTYL